MKRPGGEKAGAPATSLGFIECLEEQGQDGVC